MIFGGKITMAKADNKKAAAVPQSRAPQGYAWAQRNAVGIDESYSLLQMIPSILFSCIVILIVRMETYSRPMTQFYWTSDSDTTGITDFFSLLKAEVVLFLAAVGILMIIFRLISESFAVKRTWLYIPMAVYSAFVVLSYITSKYKPFALLGYNDRFEGTLPLLAYMLMLFLIINSVNTEKNVRMVLWPLAVVTVILSLIGISQATDHDFFRTVIGQKIITPNTMTSAGLTTWELIDQAAAEGRNYLNFTFQNREIYQTVYNINYVSFYLTLLVPLFGMLFIRSISKDSKEPLWKKIALGAIMALIIFNLIGSNSSGGYLGIAVMGVAAIIIFNKQLLRWWKPLLAVFIVTGIVMGITVDRWLPEIKGAVGGVTGESAPVVETPADPAEAEPASIKPVIDYFLTGDTSVETSINGNKLTINWLKNDSGGFAGLEILDAEGQAVAMSPIEGSDRYSINDDRYRPYVKVGLGTDPDGYYVCMLDTLDIEFVFVEIDGHIYYRNGIGYYVDLEPVERIGFENNPMFGSGRGDIWSHSFPLLKNTIFTGVGADCYCLVYPHNDYARAYSIGDASNILLIVDKPHNMYLHMAIGTGCISLIAILALYIGYIAQSIRLFWKRDLKDDYLSFAGAGLFLGVIAFTVTGLVDDSTISVMPMFYSLLGMGIAINMIIKRRDTKKQI